MSDRTENVYKNQPDERQSMTHIPTNRFCSRYRALSQEEKQLHDNIKEKAAELEQLFLQTKEGRYRALSLTALEEAVMWNIKGLTM